MSVGLRVIDLPPKEKPRPVTVKVPKPLFERLERLRGKLRYRRTELIIRLLDGALSDYEQKHPEVVETQPKIARR